MKHHALLGALATFVIRRMHTNQHHPPPPPPSPLSLSHKSSFSLFSPPFSSSSFQLAAVRCSAFCVFCCFYLLSIARIVFVSSSRKQFGELHFIGRSSDFSNSRRPSTIASLLEKKIRREKDAAGNSETRWQMPSALL
jgi:hypothetical protein